MSGCAMEMCPNWGGDGRVCTCALLDLEPPIARPDPFDSEFDYGYGDEVGEVAS